MEYVHVMDEWEKWLTANGIDSAVSSKPPQLTDLINHILDRHLCMCVCVWKYTRASRTHKWLLMDALRRSTVDNIFAMQNMQPDSEESNTDW